MFNAVCLGGKGDWSGPRLCFRAGPSLIYKTCLIHFITLNRPMWDPVTTFDRDECDDNRVIFLFWSDAIRSWLRDVGYEWRAGNIESCPLMALPNICTRIFVLKNAYSSLNTMVWRHSLHHILRLHWSGLGSWLRVILIHSLAQAVLLISLKICWNRSTQGQRRLAEPACFTADWRHYPNKVWTNAYSWVSIDSKQRWFHLMFVSRVCSKRP